MSAIVLALISFAIFALGYRYYSKYLSEKIFKLDPNYVTPAHQYNDGVDFVPTRKFVLWGHHFSSIAGAAPILGPAIALYWGWLPAILWVVLGTVFAAGVHDFGTLALSVRNKGQSVGTIAERLIGQRAKLLFLFIILFLVLMVNAVFAWVIANLLISYPAAALSVFIQIPLAIAIGYAVYKKNARMLLPSVIALIFMYGAAILATRIEFLQIDIVGYLGGEDGTGLFGLGAVSTAFLIWIVVTMVYVYFASTWPVWLLLQPRDFINSHQMVIGMGILYIGLLFTSPTMTAPVTNTDTEVSWLPLLFITIACGAISGFHGLVSSGTSAKQLNRETDARVVGYAGALGEGLIALISILAVGTFFASTTDFFNAYTDFNTANAIGMNTFIEGAASLAGGLGIPHDIATTIVAVLVISLAATTIDTSIRLMRYIIAELGAEYNVPALTKKHVGTSIAVLSSTALVIIPEGPQGFGSGGYLIWPLFGTTNQLLAGISLLLIAVWLKRLGRSYVAVIIPMVFVMVTTLWAMTQQVFFQWSFWGNDSNLLLFTFGAIIFVFTIWIILTAINVMRGKYENPLDKDNVG